MYRANSWALVLSTFFCVTTGSPGRDPYGKRPLSDGRSWKKAMRTAMITPETAPVIQNVPFQPVCSTNSPIIGAASAGPTPHAAISTPIPSPRWRRNQIIAAGLSDAEEYAEVQVELPWRRDRAGQDHPDDEQHAAAHHGLSCADPIAERASKRRRQRGNDARQRVGERDRALTPVVRRRQRVDEHTERHADRRAYHLHHSDDADDHPGVVPIESALLI